MKSVRFVDLMPGQLLAHMLNDPHLKNVIHEQKWRESGISMKTMSYLIKNDSIIKVLNGFGIKSDDDL